MWYDSLIEKDIIPDALMRAGIRSLLRKRIAEETAPTNELQQARLMEFVRQLKSSPIAVHTAAANEQHYEVPTDFYLRVLGPRLKYSSCIWNDGIKDLAAAENAMLDETVRRAGIEDGHTILDLGCGWGSFTLYAAARFRRSAVHAVSNSRTQKQFIDERARELGLTNVTVTTCDANTFETSERFDRIVSVEMLEHMRNYESLFAKAASWLKPGGRFFAHIFCHRTFAYPFESTGDHDWMARYFFSGGIMPSADLFHYFQKDLRLLEQWTVNGQHYEKTLNAWLARMDQSRRDIMPILAKAYGENQSLKWWSYWRIFFMSCAELFGFNNGREWFVAHYLFEKKPS